MFEVIRYSLFVGRWTLEVGSWTFDVLGSSSLPPLSLWQWSTDPAPGDVGAKRRSCGPAGFLPPLSLRQWSTDPAPAAAGRLCALTVTVRAAGAMAVGRSWFAIPRSCPCGSGAPIPLRPLPTAARQR
jgi:hypothetical protein